jgi:hypothetical protein
MWMKAAIPILYNHGREAVEEIVAAFIVIISKEKKSRPVRLYVC